jgi:hypothetical protein
MGVGQDRYRCDSTRLRLAFLVESSGDALPDALMRSGVIVVTHEFGDEAMQLGAVENKHVVQAFSFEGTDEALAVGVCFCQNRRWPWAPGTASSAL